MNHSTCTQTLQTLPLEQHLKKISQYQSRLNSSRRNFPRLQAAFTEEDVWLMIRLALQQRCSREQLSAGALNVQLFEKSRGTCWPGLIWLSVDGDEREYGQAVTWLEGGSRQRKLRQGEPPGVREGSRKRARALVTKRVARSWTRTNNLSVNSRTR